MARPESELTDEELVERIERYRQMSVKSDPIIQLEEAAREEFGRRRYERLLAGDLSLIIDSTQLRRFQDVTHKLPSKEVLRKKLEQIGFGKNGKTLLTEFNSWTERNRVNGDEVLKLLWEEACLWNSGRGLKPAVESQLAAIECAIGATQALLGERKFNPSRIFEDFDKWTFWQLPAMLRAYKDFVELVIAQESKLPKRNEYETALLTLLRYHSKAKKLPHELFTAILQQYGRDVKPDAVKKKFHRRTPPKKQGQ